MVANESGPISTDPASLQSLTADLSEVFARDTLHRIGAAASGHINAMTAESFRAWLTSVMPPLAETFGALSDETLNQVRSALMDIEREERESDQA